MRSISFAWTTPALVAGRKTVTRRDWKDRYARSFHAGELLAAWDKQPRFKGARKVAIIRLTAAPAKESTAAMLPADWKAEGFEYLSSIGATLHGETPLNVWRSWVMYPQDLWVVRFELVTVLPLGSPAAEEPVSHFASEDPPHRPGRN
jgi:hypothetical protein